MTIKPSDLETDFIQLVPYDLEWPEKAAQEIKKLYSTLPQDYIVDIQHVGSTAIPGIQAKPILDIQVAVTHLNAVKQTAITALEKLGYIYWTENPDPERLLFIKGMPPFGKRRTHHVHIVEPHSKHWQQKVVFRDYLRSHPEIAHDYEILKKHLAAKYYNDREAYTEGKTNFINEVLNKAKKL